MVELQLPLYICIADHAQNSPVRLCVWHLKNLLCHLMETKKTATCFGGQYSSFFSTDQCRKDESYRDLVDQIPASKCNSFGELALSFIVHAIQTCPGYYDFNMQMNKNTMYPFTAVDNGVNSHALPNRDPEYSRFYFF